MINFTPDMINGAFEALSGLLVLDHCRALKRDRQWKGLSLRPIAIFTCWGFFNLFYYPHLGQWWSFWGGMVIVTTNSYYLSLLYKYRAHRFPKRIDVTFSERATCQVGDTITFQTVLPGLMTWWERLLRRRVVQRQGIVKAVVNNVAWVEIVS